MRACIYAKSTDNELIMPISTEQTLYGSVQTVVYNITQYISYSSHILSQLVGKTQIRNHMTIEVSWVSSYCSTEISGQVDVMEQFYTSMYFCNQQLTFDWQWMWHVTSIASQIKTCTTVNANGNTIIKQHWLLYSCSYMRIKVFQHCIQTHFIMAVNIDVVEHTSQY